MVRHHALRVFVSSATLLALVILGLAFGRVTDLPTLLALCLLMLIGGLLRFSVAPNYLASLDSVVLMAVYVIAGPWAAVIATGVAYLPQVRRRLPLIRRVFNGMCGLPFRRVGFAHHSRANVSVTQRGP